jgi:flagellar hook-associated protein 1 FlgK
VGTLFSTLDIARSGLLTAQVQMDVAGHNVANVNKEGFSRQRVSLATRTPVSMPYGQLGRGVGIDNIVRMRDTLLDKAFRTQVPGLGFSEAQRQYFSRIEDLFLEPGPNGFNERINLFFDAMNDLANGVEKIPVRQSVLAEAQSLASGLNEVGAKLYSLRSEVNEEIRDFVPAVNSLSERIASINVQIRDAELTGREANDLRDDRDLLMDSLSRMVDISYRERADGQVDVLVGGDQIVFGDQIRELVAVPNAALDPNRQDLVEVRFADNNRLFHVTDGELQGLFEMRDTVLAGVDDRMNNLARALIEEINAIHAVGSGTQDYSSVVRGSNAVTAPTLALSAAGLPFAVSNGTLELVSYDASGNATTSSIAIGAGTTLNSLAAALTATGSVTASVTAENRLQIVPAANTTFRFSDDTSGALTALGVNGLFTGHDARTIGINQDIVDNPALLASGYTTDPTETGDNRAALAMAAVRDALVLSGDTASINDYYESTIVNVGIASRSNSDALEVEQAFVQDFDRRRQEVSGVSIDEEVTFILQYQRAFEASARIVSVVDRMLDTLMNMAR